MMDRCRQACKRTTECSAVAVRQAQESGELCVALRECSCLIELTDMLAQGWEQV